MTVNADEYKSVVGVDSLYVALVTADTSASYAAGTPAYLAPVAMVRQAPAAAIETQYADNRPFDVISSEGETDLEMVITGLPSEMYALILGKVMDATTGRVYDGPATPPAVALSFRAQKSNGSYVYYQYLKGKFNLPAAEASTKSSTVDLKTTTLNFKALVTTHEFDLGDVNGPVKRVMGDEDTDNFDGASWFSQVQVPGAATPSALALSSSTPTDGATGVSVSADITLTFNNALPAGSIYNVVMSKADGTVAACTNTLDTTRKIMTVNPNSNLSASTVYIVAIGVVDIYGQALNTAINFTTA